MDSIKQTTSSPLFQRRPAHTNVAPPAGALSSASKVFGKPLQVAHSPTHPVWSARASRQDPSPILLPPPPSQRPPPLRLTPHGPAAPLAPYQHPAPHSYSALRGHGAPEPTRCSTLAAAALPPAFSGADSITGHRPPPALSLAPPPPPPAPLLWGSNTLGPSAAAAGPCPRGRYRTVTSATASATAPSAGSSGGTAAADAGATVAAYDLPAHWQEQMSRAPFGRKRVLQRYYTDVIAINKLEPALRALSNAQLRAKTAEFRARLAAGTPLLDLRVEAFAVVREASRRVLGMRHYDCQLVGGMVLSEGQVAEMQTGEGKTLVATLPGYLGALTGRGVHVVTVNDYLAARDAAWMGKLYRFLGLTCAAVQSTSSQPAARAAFAADVTYVTGQELGFAYLRDNTALSPSDLILRDDRFHFAIVDEVDSILIDESRNPMIISGQGSCDTRVVQIVDKAVRKLWQQVQSEVAGVLNSARGVRGGVLSDTDQQQLEKQVKSRYYKVDEKSRTVSLTQTGTHLVFLHLLDEGAQFSAPYPGVHSLWEEAVPWGRLAITSLKAYELYLNGKEYIVREGEAVIVDPSTGRLRSRTRWEEGLHQAIEAKEGLSIQPENVVTATITFQLFFRQYEWLSGMTGTAQPAAAELFELYGIKVVPVPTNRPSRRVDRRPRLFTDKALKMHALAGEVLHAAEQRRPVLIGTTSVQESELILHYLQQTVYGAITATEAARRAGGRRRAGGGPSLPSGPTPRITLLNAKPELVRLEAQVIAQAGLPGAVTIATNMAGRGTDIILGGNPEGLTKLALMRLVYRRLLRADERESLPPLPLSQLDPYDTDDFADLTRIPFSTPEAPHIGLPRPLHEHLTTAIFLSLAADSLSTSTSTTATSSSDTEGALMPPSLFSNSTSSPTSSSSNPRFDPPSGFPLTDSVLGSMGSSVDDVGSGGGGGGGGVSSSASSSAPASTGISYGETTELVGWVMDRAEVLRRKVRGTLRRTYRSHTGALETLNYTLCVAPVIANTLAEWEAGRGGGRGGGGVREGAGGAPLEEEEDEEEGDQGPIAQVWALRAALYLWLWFDQECTRYRDEVRSAGGLLVVGTSLNESPRIELQLRGRAGRQGDPGETLMLLDCTDPLMTMFGMDKVSAALTQLGSQLQTNLDYLEGGPVDYFVNCVVRWQESAYANMRLETKKYDSVMEEYRRNAYTLRRMLLSGGDMQRAAIAYVLIQRYVDELVGRYLDPSRPPAAWLHETVPLEGLPGLVGGPAGAGVGTGEQQGEQRPRMVSPLQAVLHCLRVLVNPPGRTTKTFVDLSGVAEGAATNPTVRKLLELFGVTRPAGGEGEGSYLPVFMQVEELELLSLEQLRSLANYIAGTGPLQWPVSSAREIAADYKLQLQLRTHRRLLGYEAEGGTPSAAAGGPGAENGAAARLQLSRMGSLVQRPQLRGPFAEKVAVLRNYFGEVLIGCYEARRLAARLTLTASPALGFTDIDAEQQVCALEQQTMLLWLDALWSCFLEDTARRRNAVALRANNGSNPVSEFRCEANAAYLALLDNYRDAVLEKLLVPDFGFYSPLEEQWAEEQELLGGLTGVGAGARAAEAAAALNAIGGGGGNGGASVTAARATMFDANNGGGQTGSDGANDSRDASVGGGDGAVAAAAEEGDPWVSARAARGG